MATENPRSFDVIVPLLPFERILLDGIQATYHSLLEEASQTLRTDLTTFEDTGEAPEARWESIAIDLETITKDELFRGWSWASTVKGFVVESQSEDELEEFGGNRGESFASAMQMLAGPDNMNLIRTNLLRDSNPDIRERFIHEDPPKAHFIPAALPDAQYWQVLMGVFLVGHYTHLRHINFEEFDRDLEYDIWKVVQQFSLCCRRPDNAKNVERHLLRSAAFRKKFVFEPVPKGKQGSHPFHVAIGDAKFEIMDCRGLSVETESISEFLSLYEFTLPLEDPGNYVEIIPWEELVPTSAAELQQAGIPTALPHHAEDIEGLLCPNPNWTLWEPPSSNFFDCHHMYTEDEVYQYCVTNAWYFPGHWLKDRVVFALSPLETTGFLDSLQRFWTHWNDCALTVEPLSKQLYLLETIPGRQYRVRGKCRHEATARHYFRNLTEDHAQQRDANVRIRPILGSYFDLQYHNMLRYLPPAQFTDIDTKPLGEGANGLVYGAIWNQPAKFLCAMRHTEPKLAVVVKRIRPEIEKTKSVAKFLHELDITFTALEGYSSCCVQFLGITDFRVDRAGKLSSSDQSSDEPERLFLVFERAMEGNLLDFMEGQMQDLVGTERWLLVVTALTLIAGGLKHLHRRGVVHGDLHPGNVLVTKRHYLYPQSEDYHFLLADFGEGKRFRDGFLTSASGIFVSRIGKYVAPEVLVGGRASAEADVYAFGYIGRTLIGILRGIHLQGGNQRTDTIPSADLVPTPTSVREILIQSIAHNPIERPKMGPVVERLERLEPTIKDGTAQWSDGEGVANLAVERQTGGEWTQVGIELSNSGWS